MCNKTKTPRTFYLTPSLLHSEVLQTTFITLNALPHTKVRTLYVRRHTKFSTQNGIESTVSTTGTPFYSLMKSPDEPRTDRRMDDGQRYKKGPPRRLSLKKSSENDSEDKRVEGFTTEVCISGKDFYPISV